MTKKRIAHNITLHVDHNNDGTFTKFANIKQITDPSKSRDAIDVTCLEDDVEQSEPSPVLKIGDLKFTLFWCDDDADLVGSVDGMIDGGSPTVNWQIRIPYPTGQVTREIEGWLKEAGEIDYSVKSEITRDVVVCVTGIGTDADTIDDDSEPGGGIGDPAQG